MAISVIVDEKFIISMTSGSVVKTVYIERLATTIKTSYLEISHKKYSPALIQIERHEFEILSKGTSSIYVPRKL